MARDDFLSPILKDLDECLLENKHFHMKFADAFDWLNLRGWKRRCEYKGFCHMATHRCLHRLAINELNTGVEDVDVKKTEVVAYNFFTGDRTSSSNENQIRNTCKSFMEAWLRLEKESAEFYKDVWYTLIEKKTVKSVALACFVKELLDKSIKKIKYIERMTMDYMSHNWNILIICNEQECMHDKYRDKMHLALFI